MNDLSGRIANSKNRNQGNFPKVLSICSAGLLRSPSIAHILSLPPYNCNVRCCGVESSYALILLDQVLLNWADIIVCAGPEHVKPVQDLLDKFGYKKKVYCLDLPDVYCTRSPALLKEIEIRLKQQDFPTSEISHLCDVVR